MCNSVHSRSQLTRSTFIGGSAESPLAQEFLVPNSVDVYTADDLVTKNRDAEVFLYGTDSTFTDLKTGTDGVENDVYIPLEESGFRRCFFYNPFSGG